RTASCDHGDNNPQELSPAGPSACAEARGQERTGQRERKGEHRVLEFDHFEHRAQTAVTCRSSRHAFASFAADAEPVQRNIYCCGRPICTKTRQTYCVTRSSMVLGA